jgi:hypothetical protein
MRVTSRPWRWTVLMLGALALAGIASVTAEAQAERYPLLPIQLGSSAETGWLRKPVPASRVLDDMTRPDTWRSAGTATATFPAELRHDNMRVLRVDTHISRDAPAPPRNRLSYVNLQRAFNGDDWLAYSRLSLWIKPEVHGFSMLLLQIVPHNDNAEKEPRQCHIS